MSPVARYSPVGPNSTAERTSAGGGEVEEKGEEGDEGEEGEEERVEIKDIYFFFLEVVRSVIYFFCSGGKLIVFKKK